MSWRDTQRSLWSVCGCVQGPTFVQKVIYNAESFMSSWATVSFMGPANALGDCKNVKCNKTGSIYAWMVSFCVDGHGHPGFIIRCSYIAFDSVRAVNGLFCNPNRHEATSAVTISSWTSEEPGSFLGREERSFSFHKSQIGSGSTKPPTQSLPWGGGRGHPSQRRG